MYVFFPWGWDWIIYNNKQLAKNLFKYGTYHLHPVRIRQSSRRSLDSSIVTPWSWSIRSQAYHIIFFISPFASLGGGGWGSRIVYPSWLETHTHTHRSATCLASCGWLLPVNSFIEFVAMVFIFQQTGMMMMSKEKVRKISCGKESIVWTVAPFALLQVFSNKNLCPLYRMRWTKNRRYICYCARAPHYLAHFWSPPGNIKIVGILYFHQRQPSIFVSTTT